MSSLSYGKGVKTKFRNLLEKELTVSLQILNEMLPETTNECDRQITKCDIALETRIKYKFIVKKVCLLFENSDEERQLQIIEDDSNLCAKAVKNAVLWKRHKELLTSLKEKNHTGCYKIPTKRRPLDGRKSSVK